MTPWADVVVIGGGIAGAACAHALAVAGRRVVLLERGLSPGAATDASAGMLAAQIEAHAGDVLLPLALAGRGAYRRLLAALPLEMAHRLGFRQSGILHLALCAGEAEALRAQCEAQRGLGLEVDWLEGDDVRRHHPAVHPAVCGALLSRNDGCVNSVALAAALRTAAFTRGARIVTAEASALMSRSGRVSGVRSSEGSWRTRWVVLAAGAWSPLLPGLPRALPITPVRGQVLVCPRPEGWDDQVLFGPRGYIVPRGDQALLGSTMEHVGFDASTTDAGLAQVRAAAAELLPDVADAPATSAWAGLRPMTPDGLPILGADPECAGLVYATGHGRNGILLGPITGEIVRDLIVRGETSLDVTAYGVTRFAND